VPERRAQGRSRLVAGPSGPRPARERRSAGSVDLPHALPSDEQEHAGDRDLEEADPVPPRGAQPGQRDLAQRDRQLQQVPRDRRESPHTARVTGVSSPIGAAARTTHPAGPDGL
jgi:hypothetical protein